MDRVDSTQNGKPRFGIRQRNACTAGASLFGLLLGVSGCLGEGEAAGTPNTATETETETETAARPITTVTDMKGYTTTTFGSRMANRCALTVPVAFNAINNTANRIRYKSMGGKVLPPTSSELGVFDNWDEHIQGFSRIAMTGTDNHWAAVSRASHVVGTGGFFLINLVDVRGGDGTRWAPNGTSFTGEPPADRRTYLYYPMSSTDHPGGLQSYGSLLAVAANGASVVKARPRVDIFERRDTEVAYDPLTTLTIGTYGEPNPPPDDSITAVGLARLQDARYLLFVLDKDDRKRGWFYVSDQVGPSTSMTWSFVGQVPVPRRYQNVTLVTECGTRDIYMVATNNDDFVGPLDAGTEYADLLKVNMDPVSRVVSLSTVQMRNFATPSGGYCTFRAAATGFVDKDGKLLMYCHTHHANTDFWGAADSKLKLGEYGSNL